MLAIEMLPAGHGDGLVVEWSGGSRPRRMLIDAGTVHSYPDVRTRLLARADDGYEIFVITHVDEDHIGGATSLLDDQDLRNRIDHVWFNGFIHCEQGGNVLGPVDGERLTARIREGSYHWNVEFAWPDATAVTGAMAASIGGPIVVRDRGDLPRIELDGAVVHLLSPTEQKLRAMTGVWEEVVRANGLVPGAGTDRSPNAPRPHEPRVPEIPEMLTLDQLRELAATSSDSSAANGSSIAFILEVPGADPTTPTRALFAADAHASVLTRSLKRFAQQVGEPRVRLDAFKLSHHGSRANISEALMRVVDVDTFLVSSNGDNHGHPNDAAIACAIVGAGRPTTFHCNYRTPRTLPWVRRGASVDAAFVVPDEEEQGLVVTIGDE